MNIQLVSWVIVTRTTVYLIPTVYSDGTHSFATHILHAFSVTIDE